MFRIFILSVALLCALPAVADTLTTSDTRLVQMILTLKGYEVGGVDGVYGPNTAGAVRTYQRDWELEETGRITQDLIDRLKNTHEATRPRMQRAENQDCDIFTRPRPRETITYTGPCVNGVPNGHGGRIAHRFMLRGEWIEKVLEGAFLDGNLHGHGSIAWSSGTRYEGAFENGTRTGYGTLTLGNGDRYEGLFANDRFHGYGTLTWADGGRYMGTFHEGLMHGTAYRTWVNGDHYFGDFRDGRSHGHGTFTFANGDSYEGEFRNDLFHGQGVFTWAHGATYTGSFHQGQAHGQGVTLLPNGLRHEGMYQNGKPHGSGTLTRFGEFLDAGTWDEGCFRARSGIIWWVHTTMEACGF